VKKKYIWSSATTIQQPKAGIKKNADYELDSLCRSDSACRENHKHCNGEDKGRTATVTRQQKLDKT
jgi:hypothetical protein